MDLHFNGASDGQAFEQELAVLRAWDSLEQSLLSFASTSSASPTSKQSRHTLVENHITRITAGCARIWWKPVDHHQRPPQSRLIEIRYQQIPYGTLELAPGYLVSHLLPGIPQRFADLCGVLLALAEHEELVWHQLRKLSPPYDIEAMKALTPR